MKLIGFDGKRAVMNYTGIGNYSRLALESILPLMPDAILRLYTPKLCENPRLSELLKSDRVELRTPDTLAGRLMPHVWRSRMLSDQLKRERPALYHGLSNELPLNIRATGVPTVVTIHDLIFLRHPEFYHHADVEICDRKFRYAAENADRVIAISQRTADDLRELYDIPEDKIRIVYQGCSPLFSKPIAPEKIAELRQLYGRYIIGVGTIEKRKNQLLTVRALAAIPADINLVLVGRKTAYAKEILEESKRLGLNNRIFWLENVPMAEIPALYAAAQCASYPSFYEGFGIPMLEAIAAGVPLVAAKGSCLEEAGGPGALYVDPNSAEEYAEAAKSLIDNHMLREEMVARGRQYIQRFAPEKFGQGLVNVYNELL
ncbi:MAG: glycosyltransferase family 4 protein [Bacteroides sp.]|nr:glycosyltransferase family 4 protein [Bacteroides sp.]MCM1378551.1 glycosyltransferase family 4 protein [Bacteroides sp.]MCM1444852.1 glycosyltransferase family 4 protein [Prevotella sp.]